MEWDSSYRLLVLMSLLKGYELLSVVSTRVSMIEPHQRCILGYVFPGLDLLKVWGMEGW
jgi:hypothetical protein